MFADLLEYDWVLRPVIKFDSVGALITRLSRLCGGEGPGLLDFQDFFGCGWSGGWWEKSGCDDLAAEAGEHVQGGRFGLRPVPRRGRAAVCGVGGGVANGLALRSSVSLLPAETSRRNHRKGA